MLRSDIVEVITNSYPLAFCLNTLSDERLDQPFPWYPISSPACGVYTSCPWTPACPPSPPPVPVVKAANYWNMSKDPLLPNLVICLLSQLILGLFDTILDHFRHVLKLIDSIINVLATVDYEGEQLLYLSLHGQHTKPEC